MPGQKTRATRPAAVSVVGLLLWCATAHAGHDIERTAEFLGFTRDGGGFLLMIRDADAGDYLSLRSFQTGKQKRRIDVDDPAQERELIEKARKRFKVEDPGKEGQVSPDGRFTIVGFPKGPRFVVKVMRGERSAVLHKIDLHPRHGRPAPTMMLKSVYWSADGHRLVLLLEKKVPGDNGMKADVAVPVKFFASSLEFK